MEDWFHVCGLDNPPVIPPDQWRVRRNVEKMLALLAEFKVRATFFVLGCVAEGDEQLIPMIAAGGHEIASHGYSHRLVTELGPQRFKDEIRRTARIIEGQCGARPVGFRAPQWSLGESVPWAFDILLDEGYRYDSSLNPLPFVGKLSGQRNPYWRRSHYGQILEIPPMVTSSPFGNLPTGGGWGFRFFPLSMIGGTMQRRNRAGLPAVIYLHPREMEDGGPRLKLSPLRAFAAYGPRRGAEERLRYLLQHFRFATLKHLVETWESV